MWPMNRYGTREYPGGKENWPEAAAMATRCGVFVADVEEEMVADEARSCYNCRYRRWTALSFTCNVPERRIDR